MNTNVTSEWRPNHFKLMRGLDRNSFSKNINFKKIN